MNARWISHLLKDERNRSCILNAKKLLRMFPKYSKKTFNNLVTGDETWVYYFEPKRKCYNNMGYKKCHMLSIAKRQHMVKKV